MKEKKGLEKKECISLNSLEKKFKHRFKTVIKELKALKNQS